MPQDKYNNCKTIKGRLFCNGKEMVCKQKNKRTYCVPKKFLDKKHNVVIIKKANVNITPTKRGSVC